MGAEPLPPAAPARPPLRLLLVGASAAAADQVSAALAAEPEPPGQAGVTLARAATLAEAETFLAAQPAGVVLLADPGEPAALRQSLDRLQAAAPAAPILVLSPSVAAATRSRAGATAVLALDHLDGYHLREALLHALEQRQIQARLTESETRFRRLAENAADLIYRYRLAEPRGFEYVSPSVTALTGYSPAEYYADPDLGVKSIHPDDRHIVEAGLAGQVLADQPLTLRRIKKDGTIIWTEQRNVLVTDPATGQPAAIEGIVRDITPRKQVEETLRLQAAALASADEGILITDRAGAIVWVNPAFSRLTGYAAAELLGQNPRLLEADPQASTFYDELWPTVLAGQVYRGELVNRRRDGSRYTAAETITPVRDERGQVTHCVFIHHDVSERKRAETDLARSAAELAALYRASAPLVGPSGDAAQLADKIVRAVTREFALADCGVLLVDDERQELARLARAGDYPVTTAATLRLGGPGLALAAVETGETIYAPDVRADPRYVANESLTRSELVVPLRAGARVIGVLDLQSPQVNAFDERAQRLVTVFAERAAVALHTARLDEAHTRQAAELATLAAVSAALRTAITRAEMLPVILDQLLSLLQVDGAMLVTRDPATGESVIELGRGQMAASTGLRLAPGEGISGRVIDTGQPYQTDDLQTDPLVRQLDRLRGLRAMAGVPLSVPGQTIGLLWIGHTARVTADQVRQLTAIADLAANALHRATLFEQTTAHLRRLAALHTIDATISGSRDLGLTLRVVLEHVTTELGADAAGVLLLDPHSQFLAQAAARGLRSHGLVEQTRVRLGDPHAGRVALGRRPLIISDLAAADNTPHLTQLVAAEGFRSYVAVPLLAKGQVMGVLEVWHRAPLAPAADWLNFLETLAGQAALAVENSRLFDGLQRANVELHLAYDATIEGWAAALDARDQRPAGRARRLADLTLRLARALGLADVDLVHARRGALLHDVGQMALPDALRLKPGPLTPDEWVAVRRHPALALEMLAPIAYLKPALDIPYSHHEKWDGTGYPRGLRGEQIPLAARLFAVVDVWEALRSDRPDRPAWSDAAAEAYLREQSGRHFDPAAVNAFWRLLGSQRLG